MGVFTARLITAELLIVSDGDSVELIALDNARRSKRNEYTQESAVKRPPTSHMFQVIIYISRESAYWMTVQESVEEDNSETTYWD